MTQVSSLYLHVPFCRHLCNYCDFYKQKLEPGRSQIEEFHQFLTASWDRHEIIMREQNVKWSPLDTIYLGGGTPSLWGSPGAKFFRDRILSRLTVARPEFTMEVDPGTWDTDMIAAWEEIGLNRISIGTQTLDPDFLKVMDRVHSLEDSFRLLEFCEKNHWNFSLDFLLGIPHSKGKRNITKELDALLAFGPKHISLYILNARSKYPLIDHLPDDEYIRDEYLTVSRYLQSKGFHHYEVSNFSLPGFESRHNRKYWNGETVAGLGPTATGYFALGEEKAFRYIWKVSSAEIQPENLGSKELGLERIYLGLRTSEGWAPGTCSSELFDLFSEWQGKGYGDWDGQRMKLTPVGFVMLDSIMDDLFRRNLA